MIFERKLKVGDRVIYPRLVFPSSSGTIAVIKKRLFKQDIYFVKWDGQRNYLPKDWYSSELILCEDGNDILKGLL